MRKNAVSITASPRYVDIDLAGAEKNSGIWSTTNSFMSYLLGSRSDFFSLFHCKERSDEMLLVA